MTRRRRRRRGRRGHDRARGDRGATIAPRTAQERKDDILTKLSSERDAWVATADGQGQPHLVPLSLCWDGTQMIVQVQRASRTARNATTSGRARVAVGTSRDVVLIDATVASTPADKAPEIAALYRAHTGWDSNGSSADRLFLLLSPVRVQAWSEANEFRERTVMRDGSWLL